MDRGLSYWAEYFEQLFTGDPSRRQLQTAGLQTLNANSSIDETAPSMMMSDRLWQSWEEERLLLSVTSVWRYSKLAGKAKIRGLHAV